MSRHARKNVKDHKDREYNRHDRDHEKYERHEKDEECEKTKKHCEKVYKQCVKNQSVLNSTIRDLEVTNINVIGSSNGNTGGTGATGECGPTGPVLGGLNVNAVNTQNLFINNKLFPTSIIPFKISGTTTIVGTNQGICPQDCPPATPCTPTGGFFALGNSFSGKVTFCNVDSLRLNLANLVLSNDDDFALEIINCNQVFIYGGSIDSLNATAVRVSCSTDVTFKHINTTDSSSALLIEDSANVQVVEWHLQRLTDFAFRFIRSNYIQFTGLDINQIGAYASPSLISGENSDMIFINNCAFYDINSTDATGTKSIISMDLCFDVKISHISILRTFFTSAENSDVNVYHVYFQNSGSLVLGSFIIDGDALIASGTSAAAMSCLRLENCNNVFMAHHLMTDNYVQGDENAASLSFQAVSALNVETMTMNSSKICTNFVNGGGVNTAISVRAFYGEEEAGPAGTFRSGNWFLSGNICNQSYVEFEGFLPNASVYGFEIENVSSTIVLQNCSSNNNGNDRNNLGFAGGFRVVGVLPDNNTNTNININHCAANQNNSNNEQGQTTGFLSTYSNTLIINSEAISNTAGGECYGFLLPGLSAETETFQLTVSLFNCTANTNFSTNGAAYGLYAGAVDLGEGLTMGVQTLAIKKCTFSANGPPIGSNPPNPGYGIYMNQVVVSSLIGNLLNSNNFGLYIEGGNTNSILCNSALYNDYGFTVVNSPDSLFEKNIAQSNTIGYSDNTAGGNTYYTNKSVSDGTPYLMTGFTIPHFRYNKATGTFTFVSGEPTLNAFTNLSS